MSDNNTAIVEINNAEMALSRANDIHEILELRDRASALEAFANAQGFFEAAQKAKIYQLKAERKAGAWLEANVNHKGAAISQNEYQDDTRQGLPDGVDKLESSRWQLEAALPEENFNEWVDESLAKGKEISASALREISKNHVRKQKRAELEKQAENQEVEEYSEFKLNHVYIGDIAEIELPASSVDMIFTDPPYHDEYLYLYELLASFALHSLKDGAYLMVYCGKKYLPNIMNILGEKLEYVWTFGVFQPDNNQKFREHHIFEAWRPIVCYKKAGKTNTVNWQPDMVKGTRDKAFHEWQQQIEPPLKWIEAYTVPGELVVDPFAGGGTTLKACKMLNRNYLGFDKDETTVKIAKMRLGQDE